MFALVDCNSFYASCEQIFRPNLRGKPIVVLSNNDGCIVARSKEAKALNIPDLNAYFQLKDYLAQNNVHVFSSNYALYGDISNRVMETLKQFSPAIEVYSIDEMFLDMKGFSINLDAYGHTIKRTLWQQIRMPVGVGIASTKTLAKLANHAAKKIPKCDGVCVLDTLEKSEWLLKRVAANKVWGVGKRLSKKLSTIGISTALELARANKKQIRSIGGVTLERTANELNGIPCLQLEEIENKKQIFSTRSFGQKVSSLQGLQEAISLYATRACEKLRKQKHLVKTIYIFAHTSPHEPNYYSNSLTIQLPYPTDDFRLVIQRAKIGIENIYSPNKRFLKVGIGLIELVDKNEYKQADFFSRGQPIRSDKLMNAIDLINAKYGTGSVMSAAQGLNKPWVMRRQFLTPAYTSSWDCLPIVGA